MPAVDTIAVSSKEFNSLPNLAHELHSSKNSENFHLRLIQLHLESNRILNKEPDVAHQSLKDWREADPSLFGGGKSRCNQDNYRNAGLSSAVLFEKDVPFSGMPRRLKSLAALGVIWKENEDRFWKVWKSISEMDLKILRYETINSINAELVNAQKGTIDHKPPTEDSSETDAENTSDQKDEPSSEEIDPDEDEEISGGKKVDKKRVKSSVGSGGRKRGRVDESSVVDTASKTTSSKLAPDASGSAKATKKAGDSTPASPPKKKVRTTRTSKAAEKAAADAKAVAAETSAADDKVEAAEKSAADDKAAAATTSSKGFDSFAGATSVFGASKPSLASFGSLSKNESTSIFGSGVAEFGQSSMSTKTLDGDDSVDGDGSADAREKQETEEQEPTNTFGSTATKTLIPEQNTITGEENETTICQVEGKLFANEDGQWKERGVGVLKFNTPSSPFSSPESKTTRSTKGKAAAPSQKQIPRLLMRTAATLRLILNAPMHSAMSLSIPQEKFVMFNAWNAKKERQMFGFRTRSAALARELVDAYENAKKEFVNDT